MRAAAVLVRLAQVMFQFASFSFCRLWPVFHWLWHRLGLLVRCFTARLRPIIGYAFFPIGWREKAECGDSPPERDDEGRNEAGVSAKRPAGDLHRCAGRVEVEGDVEEEEDTSCRECQIEQGCVEHNSDGDDEEEMDSKKYRVKMTDEFYCGYDSTWETEESQPKNARRQGGSRHYKFNRFENAAKDMYNYRHGYPTRPSHWRNPVSDEMPNLKFYLGLKPSEPDGVYIHNFHNRWAGDYNALEYVHTYIQWLFPLQEPGMNHEASPLTEDEVKCFLENVTAKKNLLESYKLMLDFYGIVLCDEETGKVKRASNWDERFQNLNNHTHNNLRITRILKCLGTLGYPHYQSPLVRFFLEETLVHGELPNIKDSVLNYFLFAVLDKRQRRSLIKFAYLNYDRKDEFVWCPKKIQMMWPCLPPT